MKPIILPLSMSNVFLIPCLGGYLQVDTVGLEDAAGFVVDKRLDAKVGDRVADRLVTNVD